MEGRRQIGADHRVPGERVGLEDEAVADDRRVVDDDVEPAEALDRERDGGGGGRWTRDALGEGGGALAQALRQRLRDRGIAAAAVDRGAEIGDDDRRALRVQQLDDGAADAAAAAGDERDAAVEGAAHRATAAASGRGAFSAAFSASV